jgi:hypothetical protein
VIPFPPPPVPERPWNSSGTRVHPLRCNLLITEALKWWRRGESEYLKVLKTRDLLIFRDAKNAEHGKIAPNWNVSGTRGLYFSIHVAVFHKVGARPMVSRNNSRRCWPHNSNQSQGDHSAALDDRGGGNQQRIPEWALSLWTSTEQRQIDDGVKADPSAPGLVFSVLVDLQPNQCGGLVCSDLRRRTRRRENVLRTYGCILRLHPRKLDQNAQR